MANDKQKSWTTGLPMEGLISPSRAPDVISVEFNGTTTKLLKQVVAKDEEGTAVSIRYVGTPVGPDGRSCRFAMSIETNGFVRGSAAMNFIAAGGWGRGTTKPDEATKRESRNNFVRGLITSVIVHQGMDNSAEMKSVIERETGLTVTDGEMSPEDKNLYALLGVRAYIVTLAESRNLKFSVDLKSFMGKVVQPTYAAIVEGEWDEESDEVALTSALSEAHVQLLTGAGLKFRKVRRARGVQRKTQTS